MPSTNSPAGPTFRVSTESDGDTLIVTALGDLDIAAAERFQEELASVLAKGGSVVLLDLRKLDFIDSSGLRALASAVEPAKDKEARLLIRRDPSPAVERTLDLTGMAERLPFVD